MKRRRLSDLYMRGKSVIVDDGDGPIEVWIQKLNPVEQDTALRRANAARARVLMHRNDREDERYQDAWGGMAGLLSDSRGDLVDYVIAKEVNELRVSIDAEMAAEEAWAKDDYLQGLTDLWHGSDDAPGLGQRWMEDQSDPEAKRVFDELKRYRDECDHRIEGDVARLKLDWECTSDDTLVEKAVEIWIERQADDAWIAEYERAQVWKATRLPENHRAYYFESYDEVAGLDEKVFAQLRKAYSDLIVDPSEGKGSVETPASSTSSQPSGEAGTVERSGLLVASP